MNGMLGLQNADKIHSLALGHGFAGTYLVKLHRLDEWHKYSSAYGTDESMPYKLTDSFPDATAAALLVWAYGPYSKETRISPYYAASNAAYHAAKALEAELCSSGIRVKREYIPARALCIANGLGHQGKNGLMSIAPFGTRTVLETLIVYDEAELTPISKEESTCLEGCTACIRACPMGAITKKGLNVTRCMRYIMDEGYTEEIWQKQRTFLGCEVCQSVCPKNAALQRQPLPKEAEEAFDIRRLILGDTKAARMIAGKNITGRGRLTMEAIAFAAQDKMYYEEIKTCLSSQFEQVRLAAKWALRRHES